MKLEPTIIVTYNGITAPADFLAWLDQTEGGVNEYLRNSSVLKFGSGGYLARSGPSVLKLIEVALRTKYAEYRGWKQTLAEMGER